MQVVSELVRKCSLCKICLNDSHFAAKCTSGLKCKRGNCGSLRRNTILHPLEAPKDRSRNYSGNKGDLNCNQPAAPVSVAKSLAPACTSTINIRKKGAYLDIVSVKVSKDDVVLRTYALPDSGSDRTFCERHLVEELGATLKRSSVTLTVQTLLNTEPHLLESALIDLEVTYLDEFFSLNLTVTVVVDSIPVMPSVIPETESLQKHPHLCGISLLTVEKGSVTILTLRKLIDV